MQLKIAHIYYFCLFCKTEVRHILGEFSAPGSHQAEIQVLTAAVVIRAWAREKPISNIFMLLTKFISLQLLHCGSMFLLLVRDCSKHSVAATVPCHMALSVWPPPYALSPHRSFFRTNSRERKRERERLLLQG